MKGRLWDSGRTPSANTCEIFRKCGVEDARNILQELVCLKICRCTSMYIHNKPSVISHNQDIMNY